MCFRMYARDSFKKQYSVQLLHMVLTLVIYNIEKKKKLLRSLDGWQSMPLVKALESFTIGK